MRMWPPWLVLLLLLQASWTLKTARHYQRAGRDLCPAQGHVATELDVISRVTCSSACNADTSCRGFAHSKAKGKCLLTHNELGPTFRSSLVCPSYTIFWLATDHPKGFTCHGNKAYKYFNTLVDHYTARQACWELYASVGFPESNIENQYLVTLAEGNKMWLLIDDINVEDTWTNTDTDWVEYQDENHLPSLVPLPPHSSQPTSHLVGPLPPLCPPTSNSLHHKVYKRRMKKHNRESSAIKIFGIARRDFRKHS